MAQKTDEQADETASNKLSQNDDFNKPAPHVQLKEHDLPAAQATEEMDPILVFCKP